MAAIEVVVFRWDDETVGIERIEAGVGGGNQAGAVVDVMFNRIKSVGRQARQRHGPVGAASRKFKILRYVNAIFHHLYIALVATVVPALDETLNVKLVLALLNNCPPFGVRLLMVAGLKSAELIQSAIIPVRRSRTVAGLT